MIHGIVTRFRQAGRVYVDGGQPRTAYRAEIHPWLWFLTRTTDSRIFQDRSVPDIVKQIFDDLGFSDYKDELTGSYAPREVCVQYQETAFQFVSRLLEEEGIYYYFQHEDGKHTSSSATTARATRAARSSATYATWAPSRARRAMRTR